MNKQMKLLTIVMCFRMFGGKTLKSLDAADFEEVSDQHLDTTLELLRNVTRYYETLDPQVYPDLAQLAYDIRACISFNERIR